MARRPGPTLLAGLLASALAVAGCGGEQVAADEVPIAPPALTLPKGEGADPLAADADAGAGTQTSTTETTPAETTPEDTGATGGTGGAVTPPAPSAPPAGGTTGGGTGATGGGTPSPQPEAPAADTGGTQFEEFCEQNQGAC